MRLDSGDPEKTCVMCVLNNIDVPYEGLGHLCRGLRIAEDLQHVARGREGTNIMITQNKLCHKHIQSNSSVS